VEVVTWKMQDAFTPGDPYHEPAARFAESVTTMTGGRLVVDLYPGGAVWPAYTELDGLREGALDAAHTSGGYHMHLAYDAGVLHNMCGGFSTTQLIYWCTVGPDFELHEEVWAPFGVRMLGRAICTGEDWAYTSFPLNTVSDIQKLKMRTGGDGGEILARMGASTVSIPGAELYESMQRGVINAFEYGGASSAWDMGFHEVMDYLYVSLSRVPGDTTELWAREASWAELTPDLQKTLMVAARAELTEMLTQMTFDDAAAIDKMRDYGVQILPLPVEIDEEFMRVVDEYYDDQVATKGPLYAKIVQAMRDFKEECERIGIH